MSAIAGLLSIGPGASGTGANTSDLVGEYQDSILVRNSKGMNAGSTLFGLMSKLKAEPAENTEFNWFERDPVKRELLIATAGVDAVIPTSQGQVKTTQLETSSGAADQTWQYLNVGNILRNNTTGEYMQVTAATTNTISVARSIDSAVFTGRTLTAGDKIQIVTLGKDEGALPVRSAYEEPTIMTNYIQTYNSTVELTNAFKANKLRSDLAGPLKARRIQALERIAKDIEMSFLLGTKQRLTGTNGYQYYTGGVKAGVDNAGLSATNYLVGNGGSGVAIAVVQAWMQSFMTVGSDAKLALCGPLAYSVFSSYANLGTNGFRIMNQENVFGMNITVINTPFGELDLAFHPGLKEIPSLADWMFVVDLAHVIQKTQEPLFLEPNIQTPGQDSYKEQFRAKLGLKLRFANAFGYASGLQKIN